MRGQYLPPDHRKEFKDKLIGDILSKEDEFDSQVREPKHMTEQNRKYVIKEIGRLLSEIWRVNGLAEQEYGTQHPITRKLAGMHADVQSLLQEKTGKLRATERPVSPKREMR
jgi:hypothetical protein